MSSYTVFFRSANGVGASNIDLTYQTNWEAIIPRRKNVSKYRVEWNLRTNATTTINGVANVTILLFCDIGKTYNYDQAGSTTAMLGAVQPSCYIGSVPTAWTVTPLTAYQSVLKENIDLMCAYPTQQSVCVWVTNMNGVTPITEMPDYLLSLTLTEITQPEEECYTVWFNSSNDANRVSLSSGSSWNEYYNQQWDSILPPEYRQFRLSTTLKSYPVTSGVTSAYDLNVNIGGARTSYDQSGNMTSITQIVTPTSTFYWGNATSNGMYKLYDLGSDGFGPHIVTRPTNSTVTVFMSGLNSTNPLSSVSTNIVGLHFEPRPTC